MVTSSYFCNQMKFFSVALTLFVIAFSCKTPPAKKESAVVTREALFRDSLALYPDSLIFRENLVQYYRDSSDYKSAIRETLAGIERDSTNARLYEMLAILHFEQEDTLKAISAFEKAVSFQPIPQYLISLGTMYAQTKDHKAISLMNIMVQEYPEFAKEAWFVKGLYLSATGKSREAIEHFNKSLNISFTFMEAYREKAIALYNLGMYEKALDVINKAVTLQNNYEEGYFYKGKILEKLNRPSDAAEAYRFALMYAPDYIEAEEALNRLENKIVN